MPYASCLMRTLAVDAYDPGTGKGYSVLDVVRTFAAVNDVEVPYQIDSAPSGGYCCLLCAAGQGLEGTWLESGDGSGRNVP